MYTCSSQSKHAWSAGCGLAAAVSRVSVSRPRTRTDLAELSVVSAVRML